MLRASALLRGMPQLRELYLDSVDIGDESIEVLASMPKLRRGKSLSHDVHRSWRSAAESRLLPQMPCDLGP